MKQLRLTPTDISKQGTVFVFPSTLFTSEDKLILAPMQNLTSLFFRKSFERFFPKMVDYAVSPFISASSNTMNINSIAFDDVRVKDNENLMSLIPQIIGSDPAQILQVCQVLEAMGYREVNLNMGCPKRDIVSRGRGSGLLLHPDRVQSIFEQVLSKTNLLLSIKVRTGVKTEDDLEKLLPIINAYPLKSVCIHPRRAIDFYEGQANHEKFDQVAKQIKHTIIYNGDIFSAEDFFYLKSKLPYIHHFMLGRGLIRNPFLAGEIRGMNFDKSLLKPFIFDLIDNLNLTLRVKNDRVILNKMKEISKYLCQHLQIDDKPFTHSTTLQEICHHFNTLP